MKMKIFWTDETAEVGKVIELAIGVTILLIVMGYIFAPVGLTSFAAVNHSIPGIASGTSGGNIWDAIIPVTLAALILALVMTVYRGVQ